MVGSGVTLTVDVEGQTGGFLPIDDTDLRAGVLNQLTPYFDVIGATITRGSALANIISFEWWHWKYSAVLTIKTRSAYASGDDVRSIVRHAFYETGGAMPSVSIRNLGEVQGPGVVESGLGLGELLGGSTLLILAGLVGLVYVLAYAPNVRDVARAVR